MPSLYVTKKKECRVYRCIGSQQIKPHLVEGIDGCPRRWSCGVPMLLFSPPASSLDRSVYIV